MQRGLYAATSAMLVQQSNLDVISNNLANVNTPGFRKRKLISEAYPGKLVERQEANRWAPWVGAPDGLIFNRVIIGGMYTTNVVSQTYQVQDHGRLIYTNNPLHLYIEDKNAYFRVTDGRGNIFYTRAGNFTVDEAGRIVTPKGYRLLDEGGAPIVVNGGCIDITDEGQVFVDGEAVATIGIYSFPKNQFLRQVGKNLYVETPQSGAAQRVTAKVRERCYEGSNVNVVEEMVRMIEAHRTYEASSKMVQMHDEATGRMIDAFGRV